MKVKIVWKNLPYAPSCDRLWFIDWLLSPKFEEDVAVDDLFDDTVRLSPAFALPSPVPEEFPVLSWSVGWPAFLRMRLIEETEGILFGSHIRCPNNWSLISHANNAGFSDFNRRILLTTDGVATCC